jgi:hypothetical protein
MATTITAGNATNGAAISSDNTGILELKTGSGAGTTVLTLNASQSVGVGGAPTSKLSVYDATSAVFSVDGDATTQIRTTRYSNDTQAPSFAARKTRGSLSSPTAISSGDSAGNVVFQSYGGTNYRTIAQVSGGVETYTADDNIAGALFFYTRPAGAGAAATEQARITSTGEFRFNSGYGSVATAYGCRAWANFNGLLTGTNAPRAGGNVTSVTRSSAGIYTVNFTVAFPDTNYTMIATSGSLSPTSGFSIAMGTNTFTTSTAQVYVTNNVAAVADNAVVGVAFFR